jgi:hypothetical protein
MDDTPILGRSLRLAGALVGLSAAWVVLVGLIVGMLTDRVLVGFQGSRDATATPAAAAPGGASKQPSTSPGSLGANPSNGSKPNG